MANCKFIFFNFTVKKLLIRQQGAFSHIQRAYSARPARSCSIIQKSRFLEIDTFRRKLTKQRKTVTIQFSRCCFDNNSQLHTHIHEPAFIGAVGVDISVECQGYAAVTKDGRQCFDVETLLCGIGRKSVAELVIIVAFYFRRLQYLL